MHLFNSTCSKSLMCMKYRWKSHTLWLENTQLSYASLALPRRLEPASPVAMQGHCPPSFLSPCTPQYLVQFKHKHQCGILQGKVMLFNFQKQRKQALWFCLGLQPAKESLAAGTSPFPGSSSPSPKADSTGSGLSGVTPE